ncbi:peptidyl-prolyl cis-trans isomerase B (cyclophilin B) [Kibdelosporangium banguiense]|uniref:Peptidyl-prolyl cis-trans isomerase B (Cyclophilin B) n=1 Tax=Kibdelosporangium banguiense TaxID=1365924 RepID=A0ABS4U1X5_9PSEU|nr:peptidylprolyl isomerase [Kibdelosporangium banguiense]MBP2330218.1 peptidyl-prolyl cis-trans isomerase B (cyclophilin B) [Kibdelosporangium banguiense]
MPTNQQRREQAKRKLERQLARRAERAKRRRIVATAITVGGVVVVVGLIYLLVVLNTGENTPAANGETPDPSTPATQTTGGPCKYVTGGKPASKPVDAPPDVDPSPNAGTVKVNLKTGQGDIPLTLDRTKAACTVQAIEHLVKAKYYDGTPCHRITASAGLKVLQCGDPTGQGSGGPGFAINDELGSLPKPPAEGQPVPYPRGTLAMANSGPNTNGSQFFMVYGDSQLPPNYTVFGSIDAPGLATLDKIAANGITPGQNGPEDGAPKTPVSIETATVS